MLKATLMGGERRGPFQSGSNYHTSKDVLELHIRDTASSDWLEARAELIYQDKLMTEYYGWPVDLNVPDTEEEMRQQWYAHIDGGIPAQEGCALINN